MRTIAALAALDQADARFVPTRAGAALALRAAPAIIAPGYARAPRPDPRDWTWRATSLFAGCGGLDLGFQAAGIGTQRAYDIDPRAVATYNRNLPAAAQICDLARHSPPAGESCVLLAGAPCQGFSTVGRRQYDDPRNDLLARVGDYALLQRPRVIVIENVPAALSGKHSFHWRSLEDRLRCHGYQVRRLQLQGEQLGLAQRRRRLVLLCWLGSDCIVPSIAGATPVTLGAALAGVEGLSGHVPTPLRPGSVNALIARRIGPGQKLSNVRIGGRNVATWDIPEVFGATTPEERALLVAVARLRRRERRRASGDGDPVLAASLFAALGRDASAMVASLVERCYLRELPEGIELKHTYNGKFRRLDWAGLSPTVDTHFGNPAKFLHPSGGRGLTAREAMRIQGFPDWYEVAGSQQAIFTMIGNAVPPPMVAGLAAFVREALLKS